MPPKRTRATKRPAQAEADRAPVPSPYAPVIERRITRLQQELDQVARSRTWGPALGFTAAWLGLMAVFIGLVARNEIVTVAGVVAMLALVPAVLAAGARRRAEARLRAEIAAMERRLEEEGPQPTPTGRLIDAHLSHMEAHLRLVADHADRGFLVAVGLTGLGFLLVVVGIVLGVRGDAGSGDAAWIAASAGIATEGVAAVLFLLYARTLGHLRAFQERLAGQQERLLAFHHAAELADGQDRERVLAGLIAAVVASDRGPDGDGGREVLDLLRRASS
jgi:hypothetical protein